MNVITLIGGDMKRAVLFLMLVTIISCETSNTSSRKLRGKTNYQNLGAVDNTASPVPSTDPNNKSITLNQPIFESGSTVLPVVQTATDIIQKTASPSPSVQYIYANKKSDNIIAKKQTNHKFDLTQICSNYLTTQLGTNLVTSKNGIVVKLFSIENKSNQIISSDALAMKNNLIDHGSLDISLSGIPDGKYFIGVCDEKISQSCEFVKPADGKSISLEAYLKANKKNKNNPLGLSTDAIEVKNEELVGNLPKVEIIFNANNHVKIKGADVVCEKRTASPLVINLNEGRIKYTSPSEGISFDILGGGEKNQISWLTQEHSYFLVLDKNHNRKIESVNELFGNNTVGPDGKKAANGFLALKKYDSNLDRQITIADDIYDDLKLWTDFNKNSIMEQGEFFTLAEKNIKSISLEYIDVSEFDVYGNETKQRAYVELDSGVKKIVVDTWFRIAY